MWLPVFALPDHLSVGTLQRLSTLLPTTASAGDKLAVAAMVADSHTKAVLGEQTKPQDKKKLHLVAHNAQSALDLIGGS